MEQRLVEFIKSLQRPGGGRLGEEGASQTRITAFPPGTTTRGNITPAPAFYAAIVYRLAFGQDMVPNALSGQILNAGRMPLTGIITQWAIQEGLYSFFLITANTPLIVSITNISGLVQQYEIEVRYIIIPTPEDLELVRKALDDLALKGWREYSSQALDLLRLIARVRR